jgi:hypothetical protein
VCKGEPYSHERALAQTILASHLRRTAPLAIGRMQKRPSESSPLEDGRSRGGRRGREAWRALLRFQFRLLSGSGEVEWTLEQACARHGPRGTVPLKDQRIAVTLSLGSG